MIKVKYETAMCSTYLSLLVNCPAKNYSFECMNTLQSVDKINLLGS